METHRASLSWSLGLLLLGLVLPSASAQALSYREAVLRAFNQLSERSSNYLYRLLEPSAPSLGTLSLLRSGWSPVRKALSL